MRRRQWWWWGIGVLLLAVTVGCASTPENVIEGQQHAVEDLLLADAEVVPALPADLQDTWRKRFRAMALRALTVLAYLKDETIDVAAAHAKLFPPEDDQ